MKRQLTQIQVSPNGQSYKSYRIWLNLELVAYVSEVIDNTDYGGHTKYPLHYRLALAETNPHGANRFEVTPEEFSRIKSKLNLFELIND